MLITISGPEKANKSTLCQVLREEYGAVIRHWGPIHSDTEFLTGLQEDIDYLARDSDSLVVYDRSWVCDHVYSSLLGRDHRFGADPWLAEWLYGRAVQTLGLRVILAGPSAAVLARRRDETDLPVDPVIEKATYVEYGRSFGYHIVHLEQDSGDALDNELRDIATELVTLARIRTRLLNPSSYLTPPHYVGPPQATGVVVVHDTDPMLEGAWLPGTSAAVTEYARRLGPFALSLGWMDARNIRYSKLRSAHLVYALGTEANRQLARWSSDTFVHMPMALVPSLASSSEWSRLLAQRTVLHDEE